MAPTQCVALSRIPEKIQDIKTSASVSSMEIYAIAPGDDEILVVPDHKDSGAAMTNCTSEQGSEEPWELDSNYFDEFIDKSALEDLVFEIEEGNIKDTETQTTVNTTTALSGDYAIAAERTEISTSSSLTRKTSNEAPNNIDWNPLIASTTGWTSRNGQRRSDDQQSESNSASIGSSSTSEAEGSVCTLGTESNPLLIGEDKGDSGKGTSLQKPKRKGHMTSRDRQSSANATPPKRKRNTSSDTAIHAKRRNPGTRLLELEHVTSSGNGGAPKYHTRVGYWAEKAMECMKHFQENQSRLDQYQKEDEERMKMQRRLIEEQGQAIREALNYLEEWKLQDEKK